MLEKEDAHIILKENVSLRAGASHTISFRGTPGGKVSLNVRTKKGPNLGDNEDPVSPPPPGRQTVHPFGNLVTTAFLLSKPTPTKPRGRFLKPKLNANFIEALSDPIDSANTSTKPGVSFKNNSPFKKPTQAFDSGNGLVMVNPDLGGNFDSPLPPAIPQPVLRVKFKERNGNTFLDKTTQPKDHFRRISIKSNVRFSSHDIIDVVFTNPNDFPIQFFTDIHVQNELAITTTVIPRSLLSRLMADTLLFLAPQFGIRDGNFTFGLEKSVQNELNINPIEKDIGLDVDASVNIKPTTFDLLSNEDIVRILATEIETETKASINKNFLNEPVDDIVEVPNDFVEQTVNTFFSPSKSLRDLFLKDMKLSAVHVLPPFLRRSFLSGAKKDNGVIPQHLKGNRDDIALHFHLCLTDIIAGTSRIELNVDSIKSDFYLALRNGSKLIPHPDENLPDDGINTGILFPKYHLTIDVSHIDVDLDLGVDSGIPVVDGIGSAVTAIPEFLAERGLESVANWLRDDLEGMVLKEGLKFLEGHKLEIGELAASVMNEIANRNHLLQHVSVDERGWIIETLDSAQLAVPFVEPDLTDHRFDDIDVSAAPLVPIDGPMPRNASVNLNRVEHLVFLMMENRSFDNMLGYLSHPNHGARTDIDGLNGQSRQLGGVFTGTTATPQSRPRLEFSPNPGHEADTVARQINNGGMNGFASEFLRRIEADDEINPAGNLNDPERILRFHTADQVETYDDLSKTETILDRWFCSIPGPTFPNRCCYYSGITPFMRNDELFNDAGYLDLLTLFDVLDHKNKDWRVYESSVSFLRMFEKYRLDEDRIRPIEELLEAPTVPVLPAVTFIDPDFKGPPTGEGPNDDHAPTNIKRGQKFIKDIITRFQSSPEQWSKTMFVIIYDEHGGFADHVPPPGTVSSDFPPAVNGNPTVPVAHPDAKSYGVRIPSFVVSPLVTAKVGHKIYDHATVYRTIIERFMPELRDSVIIPERVRRSRHLGELVTGSDQIIAAGQAPKPKTGLFGIDKPSAPGGQLVAGENPLPPPKRKVAPDAVIRSDSDPVRPYFAPNDGKDFHEFLTRLGNPINK